MKKILITPLAVLTLTGGINAIADTNTANAATISSVVYPEFKVDSGISAESTVAAIKNMHSRLPYPVQKMTDSVRIYKKQDGIFGSASLRNVAINNQYISPTISMKHLNEVYTHETGHVVDYNSFTAYTTGSDLHAPTNQEKGRVNYTSGVNWSNAKVVSDGYRTKSLIPVKPNTNYRIKSKHSADMVAVFYDANNVSTRFNFVLSNPVMKTKPNEYKMAIYTVKPNATLDDLTVYQSTELKSLSRDISFERLYNAMGYAARGGHMSNIHEAFADVSGTYFMYKAGLISKSELQKNGKLMVIPYMEAVAENNYQVTLSLQSKIYNKMKVYGYRY